MITDLRYAWRSIQRNPRSSLLAVLVLGSALGFATMLFGFVDAFVLRPLRVPAATELRFLHSKTKRGLGALSYYDFQDARALPSRFRDLCASRRDTAELGRGLGEVRNLVGEAVSGNYFRVLQVQPQIGRGLLPQDDVDGATRVAVISDALWRSEFGADITGLGRSMQLGGHEYSVVGVMTPDFNGMVGPWSATQYWVPATVRGIETVPGRAVGDPLALPLYTLLGRLLQPGDDRLRTSLESDYTALLRGTRPRGNDWVIAIIDQPDVGLPFDGVRSLVPSHLAAGLLCLGAFVLCIATANWTGVLLARALTRSGELALRLALGASKLRLARQALTETLMLAFMAGVLGIGVARVLADVVLAAAPPFAGGMALGLSIPFRGSVFAFAGLASGLVGLVAGLVPVATASSIRLSGRFSGDVVAVSPRARMIVNRAVLLPQIALSVALLVPASALVHTAVRGELLSPGYDQRRSIVLDVDLPVSRWLATKGDADAYVERRALFRERVERALEATPGVSGIALASATPWSQWEGRVWAAGAARDSRRYRVARADVSPGFFSALGIRLLRGRLPDSREGGDFQDVAVVSESLSSLLWNSDNPLDQYFNLDEAGGQSPPVLCRVVGVVGDVRPPLAGEGPQLQVYRPLRGYFRFVLASGDFGTADLIRQVKNAVLRADGTAKVFRATAVKERVNELTFPRRVGAAALALSGCAGLLLAAVGLYGLVSYSAARRTREIGIRLALGGAPKNILTLLLGQFAGLLCAGAAIGMALSMTLLRVMWATVGQPSFLSGAVVVAGACVCFAVCVLACYVPARRAASTDPAVALRRT